MKHGLLYTLLIILAIAAIIIIFSLVDFDKVVDNFRKIGFVGVSLFMGVSIAGLVVTVIGWYLILRSHNIKIKFLHATIGQLIGNAIGFITPSMYLGGEPVKAHYIGTAYDISKTKVFSTAIFSKFQELASLILFIYAGTLVMILEAKELQLAKWMWTMLLAVDIFLGIIVLMALRSIIRNSPIFSHIAAWIARRGILTKKIEKIIPKIINTEELIFMAFKHDWKASLIAFLFNFSSIIAAILRPVIFFYFLYHQNIFSLTEIAVIFTFSQILLVFHITPACIGVFEGGQMGIFAIVGINAADAASYLLVYRFVDVVLTGGGLYLALHYNLVKFISPKIETVSPPETGENSGPNACDCTKNSAEQSLKEPVRKENFSPTGIPPK
ncbi:MAG: flippase-like domain-containing protein [Planctomycetes bacterium]|nr:flippase-like domain-containing protein [Planctomycetota bacterium]